MKIAYLIDYDLNSNSGVIQKIKQNALQWIEKGHEVYFVSSMIVYDAEQDMIFQAKPITFKFGRIRTAIGLLYNSYFIHKLLEKIEYDIVYMKYRLYGICTIIIMSKVIFREYVVENFSKDSVSKKLINIYKNEIKRK